MLARRISTNNRLGVLCELIAHSCSIKLRASRTRAAAVGAVQDTLTKLNFLKRPLPIPYFWTIDLMSPSQATRMASFASAAAHTRSSGEPVAMAFLKRIVSCPAASITRPTASGTPSSIKNFRRSPPGYAASSAARISSRFRVGYSFSIAAIL